MESGGLGSDPDVGSRDAETSGYGIDFGDITTDLEAEIDRVNRENAMFDLAAEREQERTGRFGIVSTSRLPETELFGYQTPFMDRVKSWLKEKAIQSTINIANQFVPSSVLKVPLTAAQLAVAKYRGASNQELENMAGRAVGNYMTGGALSGIAAFGGLVEKGLSKAGFANRPEGQPTIGEEAPGIGVARDIQDPVTGGVQLTQAPYKFSDGSTMILDPKDIESQQPKVVGLRQVRQLDKREQIDQLLRRARAGRIS